MLYARARAVSGADYPFDKLRAMSNVEWPVRVPAVGGGEQAEERTMTAGWITRATSRTLSDRAQRFLTGADADESRRSRAGLANSVQEVRVH